MDSGQALAAVLSPPEPSRCCLCVHTLLMEGCLPSCLSQLAWLGEESRAAQGTVTHGKESMEGNARSSVIELLRRGLHSNRIQKSPKTDKALGVSPALHSSLCIFLSSDLSTGLQQKESEDALSSSFSELYL